MTNSGSTSASSSQTASSQTATSQTTTQATEALNRMVAALSDRYNLNGNATSGKYVSTSA